jgi:hypothetical protein
MPYATRVIELVFSVPERYEAEFWLTTVRARHTGPSDCGGPYAQPSGENLKGEEMKPWLSGINPAIGSNPPPKLSLRS